MILRHLVLAEPKSKYRKRYLDALALEKVDFNALDLGNLARSAVDFFIEKDFIMALKVTDLAQRLRSVTGVGALKNYIGFDFVRVLALEHSGRIEEANSYSKEAHKFILDLPCSANEDSLYFSKQDLERGKEYLSLRANRKPNASKPVTKTITRDRPKIGQNTRVSVKYQDGEIKKAIKYKKVEGDILSGRCEIIDS
jgi:hypothetical protein